MLTLCASHRPGVRMFGVGSRSRGSSNREAASVGVERQARAAAPSVVS